jgi:hypothetical protein
MISKNDNDNVNVDLVKLFIDSILRLKSLKSIDFSKNKLHSDALNHFCRQMPLQSSIDSIQLNSCGVNSAVFE